MEVTVSVAVAPFQDCLLSSLKTKCDVCDSLTEIDNSCIQARTSTTLTVLTVPVSHQNYCGVDLVSLRHEGMDSDLFTCSVSIQSKSAGLVVIMAETCIVDLL